MKYNYYDISLPTDLEDDNDEWLARMGNRAIYQAREQTRLHTVPCDWTVTLVKKGGFESKFRVRRRRN